ncbi:MAG TPA: hypothetical protein VF598_00120, partial [Hymenobacter sp.]
DKSPEQITIDTLTKENKSLKDTVKVLEGVRDTLIKERDGLVVKNQEQAGTITELQNENKSLSEDLDNAEVLINEQTEKLANAVVANGPNAPVIVSHDGKKYRVLGKKINVDGQSVLVADLVNNKELVAKLVESGSGLLREIEAK